ncbi:hypothetical protein E5K00_04590 [Hymenobacter aquaticus]|uniref:Uncharacterized protein n=1 Tax=Hymenobacter aquaticus TaxID=1867101 RepID=A0A4Z0Q450_9BACT|nr:hypothetical protein [Hymenobacter aquaticus]TGE24495.1 hypothetical protein E5K00_04590 [Hymenobacter aquaticus]
MSAPAPAVSYSASTKTTITALNSTFIYLLAYMLTQGLYQAATVAMARRLSIPGVWRPSSIRFSISDPEWWRTAVLAVYGVGPAVCAALGVVAGLWFWHRARHRKGLLKLFLLWLTLHCCNLVLGALVADTFVENWAWYIPSWLFMAGNIPNVIVAVLSGLVQLGFGYLAAIGFLQSHDSITLMQYPNRRQLIVAGILVPWVAGSLVLAALKWPDLSRNEVLHFVSMGLLLLPMALKSTQDLFEFTVPKSRKTQLAWGLVLLTSLVCLSWRLVLQAGVAF